MKNQLQKPIETEIKDRKFKVNDDGSIDMVETLENRVSLTGREFITVVREHEEAIKNMRYNLSDEFKKLTETEIEKVEKELVRFKEQLVIVEQKLKENNDKLIIESLATNFGTELKKKPAERRNEDMVDTWGKMEEEKKEKVLKLLNPEIKNELLKLIAKSKRK